MAKDVLRDFGEEGADDFFIFGGRFLAQFLKVRVGQSLLPAANVRVLVAEELAAVFGSNVGELASADLQHFFGERASGHGSCGAERGLRAVPDDHPSVGVLFEANCSVGGDVEEVAGSWREGNDVESPTAMVAAAGIGSEDDI